MASLLDKTPEQAKDEINQAKKFLKKLSKTKYAEMVPVFAALVADNEKVWQTIAEALTGTGFGDKY